MAQVTTTRMSSKGQVVIPEEVRMRLGLAAGDQFVVLGEGDVVILKKLDRPSIRDFDRLVKQARQQARKAGMKQSDVRKSVTQARRRS